MPLPHYVLIIAAFAMVGCSPTTSIEPVDRSDRDSTVNYSRRAPVERVTRPGWQQGPRDTDGKPGEPGCPDCDGGGPVWVGSTRPK